ncbi:MAG: hypothetical protein QOF37_2790, partial [Thermoleophilaceae bacterium]|nr:hypothetical protein [Thermoleophilaceae bacterium]
LELAGETTALARYTPAAAGAVRPLAAAGKRLSAGLRASAGKVAQQQALRAYAASLARASAALGRLQPPPILAPTHEAELARLSSVSRLALRLGHAIGAGDAQQVAALLLRFRQAGLASTGSAALADRALRAYDRRYRSISAAATDLRREELRLQAKLG